MSFVEKVQYKDEFLNEKNINQNISILWGKALPIFMHRKYFQARFTRKYKHYCSRVFWRKRTTIQSKKYKRNTKGYIKENL